MIDSHPKAPISLLWLIPFQLALNGVGAFSFQAPILSCTVQKVTTTTRTQTSLEVSKSLDHRTLNIKHELSHEQLKQYNDDGFLIIRDFLDKEALEIWRSVIDSAMEGRKHRKLPDRELVGSLEDDEKHYETVFVQRINLWKDNPDVKNLILDPRIGRMAGQLAGVDGIRAWHDQGLYKPAWGNPTALHLDAPFWSFTTSHAISIWIALDDVTERNGCLYFMPGTHKETTFDNPGITSDMASIFQCYPQLKDRPVTPAVMKAGDCSFHHGLVVHAAGANMTPNIRRAMTCAFYPDGSTFNGQKNILSDAQVAQLQVGDLLDDDSQNPLLWTRKVGGKVAS